MVVSSHGKPCWSGPGPNLEPFPDQSSLRASHVTLRCFVLLAAAVLIPAAATPLAAQQADVIRGRVIDPDSAAIENATVTVTSISGNVSRTARTDRNGRFTITFPGGEGDYMVSFAAIGFAVKRFEVKRLADEEILIADAKLARVTAVLDAVTVNAPRERVRRNDVPPDVSGSERPIGNAALPADLMGDLAAMAASLPGVQLVPGENGDPNGYSVLGLGADQNNTTLNGMSFGGSSIPRDAGVSSSVATSPYDVSRGGFSGAQMSLRTRPGSNFITRGNSLNLDAPQMQWSDAAAQALGQEYSNISLGGTVSGPIKFDRAFYNVSYQLGRRSNDLQTLLTTDRVGLQAANIAQDSVLRLLDILRAEGVPTNVGRFREDRIGDQGAVFGSVDLTSPSSTSGSAFNIAFNGNWNRQTPASASAAEMPSHGGDRTNWRGGLQSRHSTYFGIGILSETSIGFSQSRTYSDPYLLLPAGRVQVNSTFDDGGSGVQMLSFGGNQSIKSDQTTTTAGFVNQLSWFSANNKHRLKLTSELRREALALEQSNNLLGTFTFNSLADLEADRPASFTRQLAPRRREVAQLVGGISLGDAWRPTDRLQIQYGARLDGTHFLNAPALNLALDTAFGLRNDRVPSGVFVSPRVGFSWSYGTAPQIAGFEGAARGPRAVVRGGVGLFQGTPNANTVGQAIENTGLPGALQQLRCVGPATPMPNWTAYAGDPSAIPDQCADGSVFGSTAPAVTLFAKEYAPPRSIRSNLQWSGPILTNRFNATIDATYSINQRQTSMLDRNFNPTERFTLAAEDGRPVFVEPTSIDEQTGQVASRESRLSQAFSRVGELRSDLESRSRQLSLRLAPTRFSTTFSWGASYVYSNVRERFRGFTGSTVGNPMGIEWGRGSMDSRHQLTYNLGYNLFDFVRLSWFGSFRSGAPYTPMIAGDVNGDGYSNDRAFVFDPGSSDPAVATAMQALLADAPKGARSCLARQIGRLAERNSCQGPWTSQATMSISFNPVKVGMPQRASISFQLANPLGAADLLFNGSDNLRGWGQMASPDQALLYVRGFDAATQRYTYDVNRRFGTTNRATGFRSPVTLTAMMRFDIGPTRERQMLTQQLNRGRTTGGQRAPEQLLRAMYGSGGIPNPMATILRQQDSLKLTGPQADSIAMLNRMYTIRIDSIWSPVTRYFAELPDAYSEAAAYDKYLRARKATVDLMMTIAPTVKRILTPTQRRKLPAFVASYLEPRYLASIRSGTAGFTGGAMFPGAGDFMIAGGAMMPAGGGAITETVIIRHE